MAKTCCCRGDSLLTLCGCCGKALTPLDPRLIVFAAGEGGDPGAALELPPDHLWSGYVRDPADDSWALVAIGSTREMALQLLLDDWPDRDRLVRPYRQPTPRKSQKAPPPPAAPGPASPPPAPRLPAPAKASSPPPACPRCGATATKQSWQRFRGGGRHLRQECAGCGRFMRYLPRREASKVGCS